MLVDLRFEQLEGVVVATLTGDVDMTTADDIGAGLLSAVSNDAMALVLDLSGVDYFDSAGIRLLYELHERLRVRGQHLRIVLPPGSRARDALELAAVLHTMPATETLEQAVEAARLST